MVHCRDIMIETPSSIVGVELNDIDNIFGGVESIAKTALSELT